MTLSNPTFRKNNADKPRWSRLARLPGHACLLKAMERNDFGAAQYGDQNWRNGTVEAYLDALLRHALALCSGQVADANDPGAMARGLEHTDAIVWNALVLSELIAAQTPAETETTMETIDASTLHIPTP